MNLSLVLLLTALNPAAETRAAASIYGEVSLRSGDTVTGVLRWEDEESLWLHHFNGRKQAPFDLGSLPEAIADPIRETLPGKQIEVNDHVIELNKIFGRLELKPQSFAVEFGAIDRLKIIDGDRVDLVLRDGSVIEANGGSNDIDSADIELIDSASQRQALDWDDIAEIRFATAPADHPLFEPHLYGTARTAAGEFAGTISWDRDEAYGYQKLDAETDDGDVEILFSDIVELKRDGDGTMVTTRDGNSRWLTGTNDVDNGNRGLMIHVPELGLVEVRWADFESLRYQPLAVAALPDRQAWSGTGPLRGSVSGSGGKTLAGALTFDLNQQHSAEHLNGKSNGVEYSVSWGLIDQLSKSAKPTEVNVQLRSGPSLLLSHTAQVRGGNFGWLGNAEPTRHLPWADFVSARIDPATRD